MKPAERREVVHYMTKNYDLSQSKAASLASVSRGSLFYKKRDRGDGALRKRLKELACKHPSYGYLTLHALLKKEGLVVNKKRTYRIYSEENLQVRIKRRKKLYRSRNRMETPKKPNQRWSMDFVHDRLANGRKLRILNIVDDFSREVVGQLTDFSLSGKRVANFLTLLQDTRGLPESITVDNGTEFTSKAMFNWSKDFHVELAFIQPGKPTQNAFVESLNGKFRNECLNQHWFLSKEEATLEIENWRTYYNQERPHSSLGYLSPEEYARRQV